MADELQSLIDRIQSEGIAKAEQEAAEILAKARAKAAEIIKTAEAQAEQRQQQAEQDAKTYSERGTVALTHAARDILIDVGRSLTTLFDAVIQRQVTEALTPDALAAMLTRLTEAYAAHGLKENRLTVLLSPSDQQAISQMIAAGAAKALEQGTTISADEGVIKGFRLSLRDGQVVHDFTADAIAEAIGALLHPELATITSRVARELMKSSD